MREVGVRSALIRWFASYLDERSHFAQFGKEASDFVNVLRGVPQGKLGPIAFVVKINSLPSVIEEAVAQIVGNDEVVVDEDTILFMDDTTICEALDVYDHISGTEIGNISQKINLVQNFAETERM
jgi:hypothetical protein